LKNVRFFLHLCTSLILTFAGSAVAHAQDPTTVGSIGIRIAQIPAEVAEHDYASAYIVSRVQPGQVLTQRLEVFNTSSQAFKVALYPGLAKLVNRKFVIGEGRAGNDLTSWTKLSPQTLTVKPGETKAFEMTISPPIDAASNQQFGVIWAEVQGAADATGIASVSRVGIRMYIPIGNAPAISIAETNATSSTNQIIVKKSLVATHEVVIISSLSLLLILLSVLFLFFRRRNNNNRKSQKRNEKQLEAQWKRERNRRREIWKRRRNIRQSDPSPRFYDEYENGN
jgi:hypothetical protein